MAKQKYSNKIAIDIGYGNVKIRYQDKFVIFPTAISLYTDNGLSVGADKVYEFEGKKYLVGSGANGSESFSTTDYKFLLKFAPLMVFYVLDKFKEAKKDAPVTINTGLALVDYSAESVLEFTERLSNITVNGETVNTDVNITLQGYGIYLDYLENNENKPDSISQDDIENGNVTVIDLGFNTVGVLNIKKGKPQRGKSKGYPGHGVSSIIKPFKEYLENTYKMAFTYQEASEIMSRGTFKFAGENQEKVQQHIEEEKMNFVAKIFNSVLVDDKKTLSLSDVVILSGGGSNLLKDVGFSPNTVFSETEPQYANVNGYYLSTGE